MGIYGRLFVVGVIAAAGLRRYRKRKLGDLQ